MFACLLSVPRNTFVISCPIHSIFIALSSRQDNCSVNSLLIVLLAGYKLINRKTVLMRGQCLEIIGRVEIIVGRWSLCLAVLLTWRQLSERNWFLFYQLTYSWGLEWSARINPTENNTYIARVMMVYSARVISLAMWLGLLGAVGRWRSIVLLSPVLLPINVDEVTWLAWNHVHTLVYRRIVVACWPSIVMLTILLAETVDLVLKVVVVTPTWRYLLLLTLKLI